MNIYTFDLFHSQFNYGVCILDTYARFLSYVNLPLHVNKYKRQASKSSITVVIAVVIALLQEKATARWFSASGSFKEIVSKYVEDENLASHQLYEKRDI